MTPHEYAREIERRFHSNDPRRAYELWLQHREQRPDLQLSPDEQRRLRGILHILMQMAAGLGWDTSQPTSADSGQRIV
jgi:hypothetical protein